MYGERLPTRVYREAYIERYTPWAYREVYTLGI